MSRIEKQCIFLYRRQIMYPYCIINSKTIRSCPQNCKYFLDRVRAIKGLAVAKLEISSGTIFKYTDEMPKWLRDRIENDNK